MSAQNSKKQKARFFVLAFALSFFVLAMMGLIVVFVLNPVEEENPSSQISTDPSCEHQKSPSRSAGKSPAFLRPGPAGYAGGTRSCYSVSASNGPG